ncbi:MAG: hypothetical protein HZA77_00485 [Candidatus Schekmanbacteria bacterium]|nr:hypothetical protein [Candidatus Schekmanbacteria bacterium]
MKVNKLNAVEMKRNLQAKAEIKLSALSEIEQLKLLKKKYGHLREKKLKTHAG